MRQDIPELLRLMLALARAERCIDDFRVTAEELAVRGFGQQPEFHANARHEDGFDPCRRRA